MKATTVVKFDEPLFSERVDEDLQVALFDFFHDVLKYDEDIWLNWGLFEQFDRIPANSTFETQTHLNVTLFREGSSFIVFYKSLLL